MRSPSLERDIWSEKNNLASSSDRAAQSIITTQIRKQIPLFYEAFRHVLSTIANSTNGKPVKSPLDHPPILEHECGKPLMVSDFFVAVVGIQNGQIWRIACCFGFVTPISKLTSCNYRICPVDPSCISDNAPLSKDSATQCALTPRRSVHVVHGFGEVHVYRYFNLFSHSIALLTSTFRGNGGI